MFLEAQKPSVRSAWRSRDHRHGLPVASAVVRDRAPADGLDVPPTVFACLVALFTASLLFRPISAGADGDQVPASITPVAATNQSSASSQLLGINDHPLDG